jgi:anti-sigma factor RsiW
VTTPAAGHDDIRQLLAAYALDGLEPAEAEEVERHLQTCQVCRTEFAEHLEVASHFSEVSVEPPQLVWDRILHQLHEPPAGYPLSAQPRVDADRRGRTVGIRAVAAFAAVAAVMILALGIDVVRLDRRSTSGPNTGQAALQQAARQAIAAPGARRVTLKSSDGTLSIDVVVVPDGTGYLVSNDLPALPSGETYQLWGKTGGQLVSFGVLGNRPGVVPFRAEAPVVALALTQERAGGVPAPTKQPLLIGALPSH